MFIVVPLVVYPFDIAISINQSDKKFRKDFKKIGGKWNKSMIINGEGKFCMNKKNQSVIRIKHKVDSPVYLGVLQHEIFHAVTFIMDRIGIKLKLLTSDEAYAYLIGYITQKVYEELGTKKK